MWRRSAAASTAGSRCSISTMPRTASPAPTRNFVMTGARRADRGAESRRGRDLLAARDGPAARSGREAASPSWSRRSRRRWRDAARFDRADGWWSRPTTAASSTRSRALLAPYPVELLSARATSACRSRRRPRTTFVGNARIKAHAAAQASGLPALADDCGIEVDALGGAPGVYTADWAETPSGRDFVQAMTRTWDDAGGGRGAEPRTARFRCTLVLAWPDGHDEVFEGEVEGQCVWPMRGDAGPWL